MEMTNELNKFLSYIHMGNSVYRIYYSEAKKFNDPSLDDMLTTIIEMFKTHEEQITRLINSFGETATDSLTAAGLFGVYKEKMKFFDTPLDICLSALKATNMGTISVLKFLNSNKNLHNEVKTEIYDVINDYGKIEKLLIEYSLNNLCK